MSNETLETKQQPSAEIVGSVGAAAMTVPLFEAQAFRPNWPTGGGSPVPTEELSQPIDVTPVIGQ